MENARIQEKNKEEESTHFWLWID